MNAEMWYGYDIITSPIKSYMPNKYQTKWIIFHDHQYMKNPVSNKKMQWEIEPRIVQTENMKAIGTFSLQ